MFSHEETLSVEYTTCELWRENMACYCGVATIKAEWGTVPQRRGKYPTKAALSRLWNPHERACTSWRAEACLRGFSIHTPDPVVGQYATQLTVEPPWRCVHLMTGWSMSANFLYITIKAEWGTVLQQRWKYPTKAALSRLWNPHEGACASWRAEARLWIFSILPLRLNEELFSNEGESIQQKPHSVDCGTPVKVRAPQDGLKQVYEFSLYIHTLYTIKIDPAKWIPLTEKACMTRWVWPR